MNSFGNCIKISIFGQSHSEAVGVVMDHLPAGKTLDWEHIKKMMHRRSATGKDYATARKEEDAVQIISGLFEGKTCGAPLCAIIANNDTNSKDYSQMKEIPRPSHADYGAMEKYHGFHDYRGGGQFSGRLTAPLVFAGAVMEEYLRDMNIRIYVRIKSIGKAEDETIFYHELSEEIFAQLNPDFPTIGDGKKMMDEIEQAKAVGDSIGGVVECVVFGVPVGCGAPMFDGLENKIAQSVFAIPGVKGIEFGDGFALSQMRGSVANDAYCIKNGVLATATNHNGGILGGMANGSPIVFRVAFKPTPSICQEQQSVNVKQQKEVTIKIEGRHDPCIVPRAAVCVEAAAALAIGDLVL